MSNIHRLHLSVFLLAVLVSVLLFAFDLLDRAEVLYASIAFFVFGELVLLVGRFYQQSPVRTDKHVAGRLYTLFGRPLR